MNGWTHTTIGDLCDQGILHTQTGPFGSQLHKSDYLEDGGVPVVPTEAIGRRRILPIDVPLVSEETANRLSRHFIRQGDILFARRGIQATGLSALVSEAESGWICGTGAILLRPLSSDIDPVFLSYHLSDQSTFNWIRQNAVGAVMPNLNESVIRRIPLHLPPLRLQTSISSALSSLDDKIETNRRMNAVLEEMARAIFRAWFVDFEPVKAKAAGATSFPGMPQETFDQLPNRLTPSELGEIPEGWNAEPLSKQIILIGGGTPKRKQAENWNGNIPWYSVRDAPDAADAWVTQTTETITDLGIQNSSAKVVRPRTTIVSARGTVGKLALTAVPMAMNQSCYAVQGAVDGSDFYTYFLLMGAVGSLSQQAHGSVFDTITRQTFDSTSAVHATEEISKAFDRCVEPLLKQMRENCRQNHDLAATRDSLLPKLISGDITTSAIRSS